MTIELQSARKAGDSAKRSKKKAADGPFEVELVHSRNAHLGWLIFGLVAGGVLLWKLAFVGKLLGFLLLIVAAVAGRSFLLTLLNAPGTFRARKEDIEVPQGLCRGKTVTFD